MDRVLGCDVSHWQGNIDFKKMRDNGAVFVFLKASQAEWTDRRFVENYKKAKAAGLVVGMYHYLDWTTTAVKQARYFGKLVQDYPPDIEPVLDYEERRNAPPQRLAIVAAREFVETVKEQTGKSSIVYTSLGYWLDFGRNTVTWADYPLWIAQYKIKQPVVPAPWGDWLFWQYMDKGDGAAYGVQSKQIDLNWFNGTVEQLRERYQSNSVALPPPIVNSVKLMVVVPVLNIRQGPATSFARIGDLRQGAQIIVEAIKMENARRVWVKHSAGWSALVYDGSVFMQEIV